MSTYTFTIPGRLPGLNEYIRAERSSRMEAAEIKRNCEYLVIGCIHRQLGRIRLKTPVHISYHFIETDRRRDKSNISGYARKVIEDSLIKARALPNDGWNEIEGYDDTFSVDKLNPRVEITIEEVKA